MDGVDCNSNGHVISLVYLPRLDLSYNHFNFSQIPSTMDNLSVLTHLNLFYSFFVGQIPSEISLLNKLSILN